MQWEALPQRHKFRKSEKVNQDEIEQVLVCNIVGQSGTYNYQGCRIPVKSDLRLDRWELRWKDYQDREVLEFLRFGWPLSHVGEISNNPSCKNHRGAIDYPQHVEAYLKEETERGATLGPFSKSPFWKPLKVSPLNTVEKRRV